MALIYSCFGVHPFCGISSLVVSLYYWVSIQRFCIMQTFHLRCETSHLFYFFVSRCDANVQQSRRLVINEWAWDSISCSDTLRIRHDPNCLYHVFTVYETNNRRQYFIIFEYDFEWVSFLLKAYLRESNVLFNLFYSGCLFSKLCNIISAEIHQIYSEDVSDMYVDRVFHWISSIQNKQSCMWKCLQCTRRLWLDENL